MALPPPRQAFVFRRRCAIGRNCRGRACVRLRPCGEPKATRAVSMDRNRTSRRVFAAFVAKRRVPSSRRWMGISPPLRLQRRRLAVGPPCVRASASLCAMPPRRPRRPPPPACPICLSPNYSPPSVRGCGSRSGRRSARVTRVTGDGRRQRLTQQPCTLSSTSWSDETLRVHRPLRARCAPVCGDEHDTDTDILRSRRREDSRRRAAA